MRQQLTRYTLGSENSEADGIQRLPHRWRRVVTVAGNYIEEICLAALFLAAKVHDHRHKVEEIIKASNFFAGGPNLHVDSKLVCDFAAMTGRTTAKQALYRHLAETTPPRYKAWLLKRERLVTSHIVGIEIPPDLKFTLLSYAILIVAPVQFAAFYIFIADFQFICDDFG
ncbi:hypothetical protein TNCV_1551241 [Trichonephila clavipes]|nr:hypothetical protein TNCV_1551241 [Trichonephila clavipes]